jgi:hypothetical protein
LVQTVTGAIAEETYTVSFDIRQTAGLGVDSVHCLEIVFQEPAMRGLVPASALFSRRFTVQLVLSIAPMRPCQARQWTWPTSRSRRDAVHPPQPASRLLGDSLPGTGYERASAGICAI